MIFLARDLAPHLDAAKLIKQNEKDMNIVFHTAKLKLCNKITLPLK